MKLLNSTNLTLYRRSELVGTSFLWGSITFCGGGAKDKRKKKGQPNQTVDFDMGVRKV